MSLKKALTWELSWVDRFPEEDVEYLEVFLQHSHVQCVPRGA